MDKKLLTSIKANGLGIDVDLTGRIVRIDCPEYSAHTKVTFYSPETQGMDGQGDSVFRTESVLAYNYVIKANASQRIQRLFQAERNQ